MTVAAPWQSRISLGETDHTHLGQLLTYMAGRDARVVVWIAGKFRDEHREALDLMNRLTDEETEFFGVVVEVLQIDNSHPAPHFKVVSAPKRLGKAEQGHHHARGIGNKSALSAIL